MVYVIDEGSVFDAPLEKIWGYLSSGEHRHPSMKTISREVNGNTVLITSERNIAGKMALVKVRNTLYPPFGMVQEHLEGPLAGSRAFQYYIPKGDKTGVTVVGDYVMKGMSDDNAVREAVLSTAQTTFAEDNENLKKETH
jgi:hypothetical protein